MSELHNLPEDVRRVFQAFPEQAQHQLLHLRRLILTSARSLGVGPIEETLKWGEPAYLTRASQSGTTLRLGWKRKRPDVCFLYFNCQTTLGDEFRTWLDSAAQATGSGPEDDAESEAEDATTECWVEGNRAIAIPVNAPLPEAILLRCIEAGLTYHSRKRKGSKQPISLPM